jgi:hypothetical protein
MIPAMQKSTSAEGDVFDPAEFVRRGHRPVGACALPQCRTQQIASWQAHVVFPLIPSPVPGGVVRLRIQGAFCSACRRTRTLAEIFPSAEWAFVVKWLEDQGLGEPDKKEARVEWVEA